MILQVYVGDNLNYSVGRLRYSTDIIATASDTSEISTTTVILSVITTVMAFIIILLVIVILHIVIKKVKATNKPSAKFTGNTDVSMYASPAYGTHQVFTEPGLDHLYEHIDEFCEDDNGIDTEDSLKMNPSCEVVDQATNEGNMSDTERPSGLPSDVAADDDHMSTNGNDEDDGYENDDQPKNDYLQLKTDH